MTEPDSIAVQVFYEEQALKPTAKNWVKHLLLLLVTFFTSTVAGTLYPFGPFDSIPEGDPQTLNEFVQFFLTLPERYIAFVAEAVGQLYYHPERLIYGISFSISLLFILVCHEMGHYIACRLYRVKATLPFFLPTPPMIGPAGTFGAFIKILSPMPSRRAVFDIGVAGPIAGFVALIPVAIIGIATMDVIAPQQTAGVPGALTFSDPLLMHVIALFFGIDLKNGVGNAFYFAAWVGLLVTALNLIPSGQLDGGHALYAALGERVHYWTGRIAFVVMATLSILGLIYYSSPSGFLLTIILAIMMRVGHPRPYDQSPLDLKRRVIAIATLAIFVLCFVPFPIKIN